MTDLPLAKRLNEVAPSATAEVFRRVAELRARGEQVISLAVGEPDFAPPKHILEAAQRALDTGPFGYTTVAGLAPLRAAICEDSKARRGVVHTPDQVVVSAGAKHTLFNLAQTLYDPGDEVVIPTPSWVSYADQVRLAAATPVFVPCPPESDYLLGPDALERAIGPRTKAVILCTPNNPTGSAYAPQALRDLAEVLARHPGVWVIVDEIYGQLCYDGFEAISLAALAPELSDRTVVVDGVSKAHAMTGFRVGWCLAPRGLAKACEGLQSQMTTSIATVAQLAALAALSGDQSHVARMRDIYRERRDRLLAGLSGLPGLRCNRPLGAFYVFADVRAWLGKSARGVRIDSDLALASFLLEHARLAVVPGSAFGTPGFLRLSYATSLADLDAAILQLTAVARELG